MGKSRNSKTWICTGVAPGTHDPFENFGPDCSVCGISKEDFLNQSKTSGGGESPHPSPNKDKKGKVLLVGGLIAAVLLLGGVIVASPQIPGVCNIAGNCTTWDSALKQAKQKAEPYIGISAKAKSVQELEMARSQLQSAIQLLKTIPTNAKVYSSARKQLNSYQEEMQTLEARLTKEQTAQKAFKEAESIAQTANKTTQSASNTEQFNQAKSLWEKALKQLKTIPPDTLIATEVKKKVLNHEQKLAGIGDRIAELSAPPPSTFFPQPIVTGGNPGYSPTYEPTQTRLPEERPQSGTPEPTRTRLPEERPQSGPPLWGPGSQ